MNSLDAGAEDPHGDDRLVVHELPDGLGGLVAGVLSSLYAD